MDQDEKVTVEFGELARQLRTKKCHTFEEISGLCGLSPSYLWRIEKNKRNPKLDIKLNILVNGFGFDLEHPLVKEIIRETISLKRL